MKNTLITTIAFTSLTLASQGATITTQTFSSNATLTEQYFLESADATWTIGSGVLVTGGQYFIGSADSSDKSIPANWTIDGGGTLEITRDGTWNLRLGHDNNSEIGTITIKNGSKLLMTGSTPSAFMEQSGGSITLDGAGSTFQWAGTWDSANNLVVSQQNGENIPLNVTGGTLDIQTANGFTTATVVPEPSSLALVGLGGLALILRRKK
jgi:hypothetical protein